MHVFLSGLQVVAVGNLFGVKAHQSLSPDCFHEKYHLTLLVKSHDPGILTRHGDMLVRFSRCSTALPNVWQVVVGL